MTASFFYIGICFVTGFIPLGPYSIRSLSGLQPDAPHFIARHAFLQAPCFNDTPAIHIESTWIRQTRGGRPGW